MPVDARRRRPAPLSAPDEPEQSLSSKHLHELLERISAQAVPGDDDFYELHRLAKPMYFGFICSRLQRTPLDPEDEWQEFVFDIYKHRQTIRNAMQSPGFYARGYLLAMLRNQLLTSMQRDGALRRRDGTWLRDMSDPAASLTPEEELEAAAQERQRECESSRLSALLSSADRAVLALKTIVGSDRAWGAALMGVSVDEWSTLVMTAIRHARSIIGKYRKEGAR